MPNIEFDKSAWDNMWLHARQNPEEEVVGVLLGTIEDDHVRVIAAVEMVNAALDRTSFYEVDPVQVCLMWDKVDENDGPETIVGYYHSHPHSSSEPSEADWAMAHPGYTYVICSLRDSNVHSFRIGKGMREARPNGKR